ncbi:MAG: hypothetical protein JSW53_04145 [Candidatus Bathyarchaeota archaeon]|nr:MAG: hypothetical protein JSW53_04145 [Candidatus Bathyarchaeota archaeon]
MKILCEKCGFLLYEGLDVKAPYEIVQTYNGRCPSCTRRLRHKPVNIEIKPLLNAVGCAQ